jgi:hypothetical protein
VVRTLATAVILIRLCADSLFMYSDGFTYVWMFSSKQTSMILISTVLAMMSADRCDDNDFVSVVCHDAR